MREAPAPDVPNVSGVSDVYHLHAIDRLLSATPFAGQLHHFAQIGSTNSHAMEAGAAGAPHGSVYLADAQTGGRGRGAHTWASPAGSGLYVSVLLRPELAPGDALWLSLAAGLAAQNAVHAGSGFRPDLRWPNDLLAGGRKLGGILTEMQAEATRVRFVVIGIGINVHQQRFPAELAGSATSLALACPAVALSREALLVELLLRLHDEVQLLAAQPAAQAQHPLLERLEAHSTWLRGKRVLVEGQGELRGTTEGLDTRGFLRVRGDDGALRTVLSGGVRAWE